VKNVQTIIDLKGGLELLPLAPIRLEVKGFMPLSIEHVGVGPRKGVMIAVSHTRIQNGDLMVDPEITAEVIDGKWYPVSFEMSGQIYQEAIFVNEDGKVMIRPALIKDLTAFMKLWNKNIGDQGFVEAAKLPQAAE